MYDSLLARSFSKQERQRLGYGAFFACLFSSMLILKYLGPAPPWNISLSIGAGVTLQVRNDTSSSLEVAEVVEETEIMLNNTFSVNDTSNSQDQAVGDAEMEANNTKTDTKFSSAQQIFNGFVSKNNTTNSEQIPEVIEKNPEILRNATATTSSKKSKDEVKMQKTELTCKTTGRSSFCDIKGDIRFDGKSATVFVVSPETDILLAENTSWRIRPYARNEDVTAMRYTREWTVKHVADHHQDIPQCTKHVHNPAILFSLGGFADNIFHAFADIIIPLYATALPFNGDVQFLMTNQYSAWIEKYERILKALSRYEFIDIDKTEDTYCFTSVIVGLKGRSNKELNIDPLQSPYSINDFRQLLRSCYSLKRATAIRIPKGEKQSPRLLIISRQRSRTLTNVDEIARMARRVGYKVTVAEPDKDLARFAEIVNSCDVLVGVHGAGLTNMLFLPEKAVQIQVVPFGLPEWVPSSGYGEPPKYMKIRSLEHKISLKESSLKQQYPRNHVVLRKPDVVAQGGWTAIYSIYLQQNITLNVRRFRPTLLRALALLHQ